jgi:hypothetical protein
MSGLREVNSQRFSQVSEAEIANTVKKREVEKIVGKNHK